MCFKVAANAKLRGEVLKTIGAQALGGGEVQLAASVDKHGQPTQATVVASGSAAWPGGWGGRCTSSRLTTQRATRSSCWTSCARSAPWSTATLPGRACSGRPPECGARRFARDANAKGLASAAWQEAFPDGS
jgi:hypothetical protein